MRKRCCCCCCRHENRGGLGACSKQKDEKLTKYYINKHCNGRRCYHLPQTAGLRRYGKSSRGRWVNYQKAKEVKVKGSNNFGEDEQDLFIKLHALLGNRWSLIAGRLPGRTEKEVEKYWNSHLKGKLISMGIDPDNHHPQAGPPPLPVAAGPGYNNNNTYYGTPTNRTSNNGKCNIHLGISECTTSFIDNNVSDTESSAAPTSCSSLSTEF